MKFFCKVALLLVLGCTVSRGDEKMEVALYWGRNPMPGMFDHTASDGLTDRLRAVFGFRHYQQLKKDRIDLDHTWKQWFVPRRDFCISLYPLRPQPDEPRLVDYEIYQEGFLLAKGKYEPSEGTPLFINGPDFKNGRLIFVLEKR